MSKESTTLILSTIIFDDEYQQFRKQGDELFKAGQYEKALNKYLSCLEVPGYERDVYAIERVDVCRKAAEMKSEVMRSLEATLDVLGSSSSESKDMFVKDSLFIGQFEKVFISFQAVLKLNPEDASMRELAFTYWSAKGNQAMNKRNWAQAKEWFEKALEYKFDGSVDKKLVRSNRMLTEATVLNSSKNNLQTEQGETMTPKLNSDGGVRRPDEKKREDKKDDLYSANKKPVDEVTGTINGKNGEKNLMKDGDVVRPSGKDVSITKTSSSNRLGLKIGLGGVAIAGFVSAMSLNNGWNTSLNEISRAQSSGDRNSYIAAYQAAETYREKVGLRNLSVTAAILALGVDAFLIIRKPKTSTVQVTSNGLGMSLQVRL
jgi:tetratricopeptide (TPR) repeat protein